MAVQIHYLLIIFGGLYAAAFRYRGVNSASTVAGLGWRHWLTDPDQLREEQSQIQLSE